MHDLLWVDHSNSHLCLGVTEPWANAQRLMKISRHALASGLFLARHNGVPRRGRKIIARGARKGESHEPCRRPGYPCSHSTQALKGNAVKHFFVSNAENHLAEGLSHRSLGQAKRRPRKSARLSTFWLKAILTGQRGRM